MILNFKYKFNYLVLMLLVVAACSCTKSLEESRTVSNLSEWRFTRTDDSLAFLPQYSDSGWKTVKVPHDWAIYGPFDKEIDKQMVRIVQNNENEATEKTGRTGALPFVGVGWYRTSFKLKEADESKQVLLTFDGAMSNAEVYVNGIKVGTRPYGYSYFYFDISKYVKIKEANLVAVRLENHSFSSRWYPGAGLYRKVQLIVKDKVSFKHWGHTLTTEQVSDEKATIQIRSEVEGSDVEVKTIIRDGIGKIVAEGIATSQSNGVHELKIDIDQPKLWSPESPNLYSAELLLNKEGTVVDSDNIRFGVRSISYTADNGFQLNGKTIKFKGVCLHHDLGPLGTAVNRAALKRQLTILKDMGCNAIRSAHNMPSFEQLELCDEMGFLFLAESFDEWKLPKVKNGYNLYFDEWAEKDVVNLVRATRNHPSIVMWSAGNEVPDQWGDAGVQRLQFLQDLFHREDPTRPVTVGMDQVKAVMENGFGAKVQIPGLNYRVHLYDEAYETFPGGLLLGSETASTVSSRGVYKFPVQSGSDMIYEDLQSSSYDLEYCNWSNIPEDDFEMQDDKPWVIGEFVWTGFDYLGEPTPYDNYWPSRSSYFGINDLAGLPKDRYYLYRSRWNTKDETLHVLPHWNWEGREGETTPVFVYTSYNSAELFINGKSQGIRKKNNNSKLERYRLMWNEVKYEPGTLSVVAYDADGSLAMEKEVHTAGEAYALKLEADRSIIHADGEDLAYITVSVVDKDGNLCPRAVNQLNIEVSGQGEFKAVCNGDATSLELFHMPTMKTFSGKLVLTVQASRHAGMISVKVTGNELKKGLIELECK